MSILKKQPRKKPGRPPLPPGQRRRNIDVTLPLEVIEMARKIGGVDSVSRGIEIAVRAAHLNLKPLDS